MIRDRRRVVAVLGPTNTGKTHLALERMLGYRTGMIGFPLRLLARENYERIVRLKGERAVALLTGEEKIIPAAPSYFVCTVESMPLDRRVDFLAVDEIQLCADPDRGHVFTDRLLHARGEAETMFLGAETMKPLIRRLVPEAEFMTRPRFSQLSYTGPRKLTRLPSRSAIVAFSAADVYAMAELIRRQRGGTAVVLGALSPRTRNAQVGMYQAGEVDYLVATDAIGMGLNMDVDHVAFAALRKFDGRQPRDLDAAEIAQIAGRAGRHMNDGTFGTTADVGGIDDAAVEAVENHHFAPLKRLYWRNPVQRFTSVPTLLASLAKAPETPGLTRAREADDHLALLALSQDEELMRVASSPAMVRLLWEVCQIPDFRKVMADSHTRLLGQIYRHLTGAGGRLPDDWLYNHVRRLDRTDGDVDTIVGRIANIRTWTYVSHRGDWVADPAGWQERTRAIEDRLSDALHERLTQRFVDRRTAVLVKRLKEGDALLSSVARSGDVLVEGQFVGRLGGFLFQPDLAEGAHAARAVSAAAQRALRSEIAARVSRLGKDGDEAFALRDDAVVLWNGAPVARLVAGPDVLRPAVEPIAGDMLDAAARETVRRRVAEWVEDHLAQQLRPMVVAREASLSGPARGILYQLLEGLGSQPRPLLDPQVMALGEAERRALARLDVRFGVDSVFMPTMLRPAVQRLRGLLWSVRHGLPQVPPPTPGRVSLAVRPDVPSGWYEAVGFRMLGPVAVRVDMLERFAAEIRGLARGGRFGLPAPVASLLGLGPEELHAVMRVLGYRAEIVDGVTTFARERRPRQRKPGKHHRAHEQSPFARLKDVLSA